MTKDRLADLQAANQSEEDQAEMEEVQILMEIEGNIEFMGEFLGEVEELRSQLTALLDDIEQLKKIQSDILSCPNADEKLQQDLDGKMASIKRTSQAIRFRLKGMEMGIEKAEQNVDSAADARIRKTQHAGISREFVDAMSDYNNAQNKYRDDCKDRIQRQMEIAGKEVTDEQIETMIEDGNVAVFTEEIVVDTLELKMKLRDIEARHADILAIEKSVVELHDLFMDVAILMESQGELVDRIEKQVEDAVEWVDRANADMKKAREYERKARNKKLAMIACVIVTGGIVVGTQMIVVNVPQPAVGNGMMPIR